MFSMLNKLIYAPVWGGIKQRRTRLFTLALVGALVAAITFVNNWNQVLGEEQATQPAAFPLASSERAAAAFPRLSESFGKLPLYFVENRGQFDARVSYYIQGHDKTIYFTPEGITYAFSGQASETRWALKLDFVGARAGVHPEGQERADTVFSYFSGQQKDWKTGLRSYASIIYRDLWPGIDLVYSGTTNRLKYQFIVRPGADPSQIQLAYRGASKVHLNLDGELEVETPRGSFRDEAPISYQKIAGRQVEVSTAYHLKSSGGRSMYEFRLGEYDRNSELVIDPAVIVYCGYIGGEGDDVGNDIAVDGAGNVYVVGETSSTQTSFPAAAGPSLTYGGGPHDAFIAKLNPTGTALIYCGYIGGASSDRAVGVAVDGSGNAYVTGRTFSDQTTFPVIGGPGLSYSGGQDAFVTKINAAGTGLVYSGYIGGTRRDFGQKIGIDSAGNAYITGYTDSDEGSFPVLGGPDLTYNGKIDAFVAKINPAGSALVYCGYVGGSGDDYGRDIAVDNAGNAYIGGSTDSDQTSFPVTAGPDITYNGGLNDAFVAKINSAGSALVYCSYVGGASADVGYGIAVDNVGNAYITGETGSDQGSFPVIGPLDPSFNGDLDTFVTKINPNGTGLVYSGYIGGTGVDRGFDIAVDSAGSAYVIGLTSSFQATFPVVGGPQLHSNGNADAYVAKLNPAGSALIYCGYLGGAANEFGFGIAADAEGNAYVTGYTESNQATFPVTIGPDLTFNGGQTDAFVAKIERRPDVTPPNLASVGAITRSQGAGGSATLAFVSDVDTLASNILVAVRDIPAGVSVTNVANINGQVFADVAAQCSVTAGSYILTLEAVDAVGLRSTMPLTVNVSANTPPTLGVYSDTAIPTLGGSTTVIPTSPPSDNGIIAGIDVSAPSFTGTISVNQTNGVVTINNAGPKGGFVVKVTATDNCGAASVRTFKLLVGDLNSAAVVTTNAASFASTSVAPESIAAAFGTKLATSVASADTVPLPTTLAGTTVVVRDSAGTSRDAQLFFVSPGQVNFYVPPGTTPGVAGVTITNGAGEVSFGSIEITGVAPGIFTANSTGQGVAAAQILRVRADGSQSFEPVAVFDSALGRFVPLPIDFGAPTDRLFLVLFGTGIRFLDALVSIPVPPFPERIEYEAKVNIGGTRVDVQFAGPQGDFVGLDQINAELPRSLAGRGEVDVVVEFTVNEKQSNTFKLAFR